MLKRVLLCSRTLLIWPKPSRTRQISWFSLSSSQSSFLTSTTPKRAKLTLSVTASPAKLKVVMMDRTWSRCLRNSVVAWTGTSSKTQRAKRHTLISRCLSSWRIRRCPLTWTQPMPWKEMRVSTSWITFLMVTFRQLKRMMAILIIHHNSSSSNNSSHCQLKISLLIALSPTTLVTIMSNLLLITKLWTICLMSSVMSLLLTKNNSSSSSNKTHLLIVISHWHHQAW